MIVEVGFEAGDGESFCQLQNGVGHAGSARGYSSEGGTCRLKFIWLELG